MLSTATRRSRLLTSASSIRRFSRGSAKKRCQSRSEAGVPLVTESGAVSGGYVAATGASGRWYVGMNEQPASASAATARVRPIALCMAGLLGDGVRRRRRDRRRARGRVDATLEDAADDDEEDRDEDDREQRRADHAAHHAGADRALARRAGAGRDGERQDAEDERDRRHQDRAEAQM